MSEPFAHFEGPPHKTNMNPALETVTQNSTVVIITKFGRYLVTIGSETNRALVLREARTNGAWGIREDALNYSLTYIYGDAILGVEFPMRREP